MGNYNYQQQGRQGSVPGSPPPPPWYAAPGGNSALFMGNAGGGAASASAAAAGGRGLTRPPLLITIGPQCAGKTSLLKELAEKSESEAARERGGRNGGGDGDGRVTAGSPLQPVTDVTIDDHPLVRFESCELL